MQGVIYKGDAFAPTPARPTRVYNQTIANDTNVRLRRDRELAEMLVRTKKEYEKQKSSTRANREKDKEERLQREKQRAEQKRGYLREVASTQKAFKGKIEEAKVMGPLWAMGVPEAACSGSIPACKALLREEGGDFNTPRENKDAVNAIPLHSAARRGDVALASILLSGRADPNLIEAGRSSLILAAEHGQTKLVEALLKARAKPNLAMQDGLLPLHAAAIAGFDETIRVLLRYRAEIDAVYEGLMHQLLPYMDSVPKIELIDADYEGSSALFAAAHAGNSGAVEVLLGRKARVDAVWQPNEVSALMAASQAPLPSSGGPHSLSPR